MQDQSKLDDFNTNILMNPGWGQMTKAKGLESQKVGSKPRLHKGKHVADLKTKSILGIKKKKEAYLSKVRMNNTASVRHLPQPPLGTSIGHGLVRDHL